MQGQVGESEALKLLQEQLIMKEDYIKDKDDEIKDLIEDKHRIETEKNEIKKKLDQEKIQKVLATEFRSTMMKFNPAKF